MLGVAINKIVGNSMQPKLPAGSYGCFVSCLWQAWHVGDIYKIRHPRYGVIVKQLAFIDSNKLLWFKGLNVTESVSMIDIGPVKPNDVCGRLMFSVSAPDKQLLQGH